MPDLIYQSSKTYTHSQGLSCCFRQWRATHSHCSKLHGYALSVQLVFQDELDERNWVQDFGDLKNVKQFLVETFDHKTVIAQDDPLASLFDVMQERGMVDLVILPAVGCEKFAEYIFDKVDMMIGGGKLLSVEVKEHEGNGAKVIREPIDWNARLK
jgi:6-pyruvoyltetrahydropterin/6-carboxytetrahydropterin synthase